MKPEEIASLKVDHDVYKRIAIEAQIASHAVKHGAKQPADLLAILAPTARLSKAGELVVTADGKTMSVAEAVEGFTKSRKHLFHGNEAEAATSDPAADPALLAKDPAAYREWRKKVGLAGRRL